jgi:hypothetical protein
LEDNFRIVNFVMTSRELISDELIMDKIIHLVIKSLNTFVINTIYIRAQQANKFPNSMMNVIIETMWIFEYELLMIFNFHKYVIVIFFY